MFKYQIHALAMRKLGLRRPLGLLALVVILGCVIAGAIYAFVFFQAATQRSHETNVHIHNAH
jgi:hypothetical protein